MPKELSPRARAVKVFGSQAAVGDILGISQPSVAGWKDGRIPVQHIARLIAAAKERGKRLTANDLLPAQHEAA